MVCSSSRPYCNLLVHSCLWQFSSLFHCFHLFAVPCTQLFVAASSFAVFYLHPTRCEVQHQEHYHNDTNVTRNGKPEQAFRPRRSDNPEQVFRPAAFRPDAYPYHYRAQLGTWADASGMSQAHDFQETHTVPLAMQRWLLFTNHQLMVFTDNSTVPHGLLRHSVQVRL